MIEPCVTDSPISGSVTATGSADEATAPFVGADCVVSISAITAPTEIVCPGSTSKRAMTPEAVAGISTSTLSVVTSTIVSPSVT